MAADVTVEPEAWPPRVRIDAASTGGVYRVGPDGVQELVRGSLNGGICYDYEAPQGVPLTYHVSIESATVVMPDVGPWLVHLTRPELSVPLSVEKMDDVASPGTMKSLPLLERAPHTVATGRYEKTSGMTAYLPTAEDAAALEALLQDESVLWLSTPPRMGTWGPWYVRVQATSSGRVAEQSDNLDRRMALPFIVQERPVVLNAELLLWELMPNDFAGLPSTWSGMPG